MHFALTDCNRAALILNKPILPLPTRMQCQSGLNRPDIIMLYKTLKTPPDMYCVFLFVETSFFSLATGPCIRAYIDAFKSRHKLWRPPVMATILLLSCCLWLAVQCVLLLTQCARNCQPIPLLSMLGSRALHDKNSRAHGTTLVQQIAINFYWTKSVSMTCRMH